MSRQKSVTANHHKKRYGQHKKHSQSYIKVYWPYLPMLMMLFIVLIMGSLQPRQIGNVLGISSEISNVELLTATNQQRTKREIRSLTINKQLEIAATAKAQDMKNRNYWSHETPDGDQPWIFLEESSYNYQKAGENLAYGFSSSSGTVSGWMQSPSHRENMLDSSFSEVGFGVVSSDDYLGQGEATIVVAFYASPKTDSDIAFSPTNVPQNLGTLGQPTPVTFLSSITEGQATWASFVLGITTGIAATFLVARHTIRLKRIITSGEHFIMHHPILDLGVTGVVIVGVILIQTAGFIG